METIFSKPPDLPTQEMPAELAPALGFAKSRAPVEIEEMPAGLVKNNPWVKPTSGATEIKFDQEEDFNDPAAFAKAIGLTQAVTSETTPRFRFSKTTAPATEAPLEKRASELTTSNAMNDEQLRTYVTRCLDGGEVFTSVEHLAVWTERNDVEEAARIREIGKTL